MIGAIIGDIVGSVYEFDNIKTKDFPILSDGCSYTDDTLMTIAVGKALLDHIDNGTDLFEATASAMREIAADYPCGRGGYGRSFRNWLDSAEPLPYGSYGNGGAMRVSPCGECAILARDALEKASVTASVTHNHPEGIRGAQAAAMAVFLAMDGATKQEMRNVLRQFYPLDRTLDEIRPYYAFDVTAQGSVPQALEAFLESESFEDALRN
ncbi:MAG: ADP-ribosylglycohydrolase family protein, partial [Clostridia bacterium]|nr:ADP-ribosylglycohydrolase family protein [Clostridia bacterium]